MIGNKLSKSAAAFITLIAIAGCASTSVVPLSADTVQVTAQADPDCGTRGAQQAALKRAAVETIRRGYDSFVITGVSAADNVRVVGHSPIVAHTDGVATDGGRSTFVSTNTTYTGGQPILGGSYDQVLTVQMFRATDPGADRAVSARNTLGPNWQKAVASKDDDFC